MKHTSALILAGLFTVGTAAAAELDLSKLPPAATKADVTFEKDIQPMLKESCVNCHGPERPKAGLRLDSLEATLKGSKNEKVVQPGESAKSLLVIASAGLDPELAMPPKPKPNAKGPAPKPLTPEQIGLVRAWIDQGAK